MWRNSIGNMTWPQIITVLYCIDDVLFFGGAVGGDVVEDGGQKQRATAATGAVWSLLVMRCDGTRPHRSPSLYVS